MYRLYTCDRSLRRRSRRFRISLSLSFALSFNNLLLASSSLFSTTTLPDEDFIEVIFIFCCISCILIRGIGAGSGLGSASGLGIGSEVAAASWLMISSSLLRWRARGGPELRGEICSLRRGVGLELEVLNCVTVAFSGIGANM
eukprot:1383961-Amorphochlora_amoeboformis.AAC.2